MNIFDRIAMLFRANVNAAIGEFEQPEKMLNQIILDMRSQLVKAKQQVAGAIADEKRLHDQTRLELKEAEDWERRAMLAVQQNQDLSLIHISEPTRLGMISYAVFCLKKKK